MNPLNLITAFLNQYHHKQNKQLFQKALTLEEELHLENYHKASINFFHEVSSPLEEKIHIISKLANQQLIAIANIFDSYDLDPSNSTYLRHSYLRICKQLYYAFEQELKIGDGYGRMPNQRIFDIRFFEEEQDNYPIGRKKEIDFIKERKKNPDIFLEKKLLKTQNIRNNIQQIFNRLSEKDKEKIYFESLPYFKDYLDKFEPLRIELEKSEALLKDKLEKDKYHFPRFQIRNFTPLYNEYSKFLSNLEILLRVINLNILVWEDERHQIKRPISELIYAGTILYSIHSYYRWGM